MTKVPPRWQRSSPRSYRPHGFLRPCLLLLLAEQPAHGYDLAEQLGDFGFVSDPGNVYRALHAMEVEGLVSAHHQPSDTGPDRRPYRITRSGRRSLVESTEAVGYARMDIDSFLRRHQRMNLQRDKRLQQRRERPTSDATGPTAV